MGHYFTNEYVKSDIKKIYIKLMDKSFIFNTDNGVFSKRGLDFGTRLLIDLVIKENISGKILDFGCGYGAIGIILSKFLNVHVDMIDVNKRAVHLANMNIMENKVDARAFVSNGYDETIERYDHIISNPPIRIGKEKLYKLMIDAKTYLTDIGCLYVVIRKNQGAETFINDMSKYYMVSIIAKSKGFFIIKLNNC